MPFNTSDVRTIKILNPATQKTEQAVKWDNPLKIKFEDNSTTIWFVGRFREGDPTMHLALGLGPSLSS